MAGHDLPPSIYILAKYWNEGKYPDNQLQPFVLPNTQIVIS